jgi:hypothetical protein
MAIRKFYSKREKKHWKFDAKRAREGLPPYWSWGYDIWLDEGERKRVRRKREAGFMTESDAVAAVGRIRSAEKEKKYGFVPESAKPRLGELIRKRLADTREGRAKTSATRILSALEEVIGAHKIVEELTTPDLKLFVERRAADGLSPSSINRELNEVSAMLNNVAMYYPQLTQWRPPKMPRPKQSRLRRESTRMRSGTGCSRTSSRSSSRANGPRRRRRAAGSASSSCSASRSACATAR